MDTTVLERMAAQVVKLPASIRLAYGQVMMVSDDGQLLWLKSESLEQAKETFVLMSFLKIPHVGKINARILYEQHGIFDETFRIAGDYELLLRELKTGDAVFIPNLITARQRRAKKFLEG